MEFARRGRDDGHRFFHHPPPHVDPMLVIREALLSQLQKDRLRQEIIQAELTKIERAMVLRNGSRHGIDGDGAEWTNPVPFTFREQSMPSWQWSVNQECYVDVNDTHDPKKKEGTHKSVALKSAKPAMEDRVGECLRPCCNGKAGQENSKLEEQKPQESSEVGPKLEEQKPQESSEAVEPKPTSPSVKWELTGITIPVKNKKRPQILSCEICQVQVPENGFQVHCAGRKHQSKEASNQKAQLTEESSSCTGQKTSSIKWSCSTCQVNVTGESDLKDHLNGRTHQQNIEAQLMEVDGMAKNIELQEPECHKSNAPQHLEKTPSVSSSAICTANGSHKLELGEHLLAKLQDLQNEIRNMSSNSESRDATVLPNIAPQNAEQTSGSNCSILQADSDCQFDMDQQIGSKIHQMNVQDLHEEAKKTGDFPPEIAENQQPHSEWDCVICQAKCYSASQFVEHCRGKKHQKKMDALQGEGVNAKSSNLTVEKKVASNGSDSKSSSSEKVEEQTALWSCGLCNLQCSSEGMLAGHCEVKEHMEKQKLLDFCEPTPAGTSAGAKRKLMTSPDSPVKKQTNARQDVKEELPENIWTCTLCQAKCTSESDYHNHLGGRRHRENNDAMFYCVACDVQCNSKQELPENRWTCTLCQAKCTSESDYHNHLGGRRHRENEDAMFYCVACDVQCNSEKMLASHRGGRRHRATTLEGSASD